MSLEYLPTKKKILFVINTMGRAGAEMALIALLRELSQEREASCGENYELYCYVLMGQGELIDRLPPCVHLLNRDYKDTSVLEKSGKRDMYRAIIKAMCRRGTVFFCLPGICAALLDMIKKRRIWPDKLLWRVLSDGGDRFEEEFDLAVAFLEGGSAYYVADHVRAKKKAAFIHIDYNMAGYTRRLDHDCYLKYDAVFPISGEVKQSFLQVYPECADRTAVFHNIIDREQICSMAKAPGGFSDAYDGIRILTVGRLTWQKSYPTAIEAMRLLKQENVRARWYVLGDGPERRDLECRIEEAGLQEDFILVGAVDNPYPYYAKTDIYVHATRFEGKSIAIQEAQILGCAIIASDSSGNREQIVPDVDGILCRLDAAAVRDAVLTLIGDEEKRKRLGQAAEEKMKEYGNDLSLLEKLMAEEG